MKKILLSCSVLAIMVCSCKKLNEDLYHQVPSDSFYKSAADINTALIGVYKKFQVFINDYPTWMKIEVASETGAPSNTKDSPGLYNNWSYSNDPGNTITRWAEGYDVVNQANSVIAHIANINMDATAKDNVIAQARFLRSLSYFYMLRWYGALAIPETNTTSLNGLNIPRKTLDETYDYIINDLEAAANKLPKKSAIAANERWRASQGAAWALLGEVLLYRGSMTDDATKKAAYFTDSKNFSGQVITSGEYQLESDFKNLWMWWNPNNKEGKESIFEVEFGNSTGNNNNIHTYGGINYTDASLGAFQFTRWGVSFMTYDSFSSTDARKAATFLNTLTDSQGKTITWYESNKGNYTISPGNWPTSCPGNLKYYDRTSLSFSSGFAASDIYILRYAEVLLNYAEAENELNGPTADAYQKLNQVHTRAGLPAVIAGFSKQQFSDAMYQERVFEFVGENKVYYDALRTDRLADLVKTEVDNGVAKGLYQYRALAFRPAKNFLWKIPTYDLNSNPSLVQNPDNVSK